MKKIYLCIDLKSFYASVECVSRNLDPLKTNLVVADTTRTEKTICLAVSPSLKKLGISGRPRLFEVIEQVKKINNERAKKIFGKKLNGESINEDEINSKPAVAISYIAATPRMQEYINVSSKIYSIYLKYIAPEDIHVYSIDEVFMDITSYIKLYKLTPRELALKMIKDVLNETGITATAGIGENMYLAKVAMDIDAKHMDPDEFGVRISELSVKSYRERLWTHEPITDFWRIGHGIGKKLNMLGLKTMGDVARFSLYNEDLLFKIFGVNAELIIDHAWGYEPCTMNDVKAFKPSSNSYGVGQVIHCPCDYKTTKLIVHEMADQLALDLVSKGLVTNHLVLNVGYDIDNFKNNYDGEIVKDYLGRDIPKPVHGSINLDEYTSSGKLICEGFENIFDRIVDKSLLMRRLNLSVIVEKYNENLNIRKEEQLSLFIDYDELELERKNKEIKLKKENKVQKTIIDIKKKYGKNSVLKASNLDEGSTMIERNKQIGGHKA